MENLGPRYEFHCHTIFSDGSLTPASMVREAEILGAASIALTDHVDASNLEEVARALSRFAKEEGPAHNIKVFPGVELSYVPAKLISQYAKRARKLGAKVIVVHGESPAENVYPGTNHAAVLAKGLVDIVAHPGNITEADVRLAKENGVYLELSAKHGHNAGNQHVAKLATKIGAKLLVNTDAHSEKGLITQDQAFQIAKDAGLTDKEALTAIRDNPLELLKKVSR